MQKKLVCMAAAWHTAPMTRSEWTACLDGPFEPPQFSPRSLIRADVSWAQKNNLQIAAISEDLGCRRRAHRPTRLGASPMQFGAGCGLMRPERQLPKLHTRVRFPSPAPALSSYQSIFGIDLA
jgi:hypothetical protein